MNNNIIFGAGVYGRTAIEYYGEETVVCFADNDKRKWGSEFCGKPVISLKEAAEKHGVHFIIASQYAASMENELQSYGITDYEIFRDYLHGFFETGELIVNPYKDCAEAETEKEWIESEKNKYARKGVYDEVERLYGKRRLFNHIEIETVNRCNGVCSFCPVNSKIDPREKHIMTKELFESIVSQLEELDYRGRFTTFSNNEPLLDDRIIEFNRYARKHLPKARMHLYTNGTLLTLDKFKALTEVLDELIIDNYHQELKLIKSCEEIAEYVEGHPELINKVSIVLRKPNEILTSRGGNAPNRKELPEYGEDRCVLPFKQMIIRPDGKVSLCCNDALGKYTLGDVNKQTLEEIWFGQRLETIRKALYEGRKNWGDCRFCDTFIMG